MNTTASRQKKTLRQTHVVPLSEEDRACILGHLKHDRRSYYGKNHGYDPSLGDRRQKLRRQMARAVIRLAMNRMPHVW